MSSKTPLLKIENLSKSFRSHWTFLPRPALHNLSLEVYEGEAFGFLGHNGAGKTTTIRCILGLIRKTTGRILLEGKEIKNSSQRSILGYLPEQPYFYDHLSVEESLQFVAALHGIGGTTAKARIDELLELLELTDRKKSGIRSLSKGLQQRVSLAQAILNRPRLLLLDEPFSGLDPVGRVKIRNLLLQLRKDGTSIFMSSHILSDVQDICDRVAIMANGRLQTSFALNEAAEMFGQTFKLVLTGDRVNEAMLNDNVGVVKEDTAGGVQVIATFSGYETAIKAMQAAIEAGASIRQFGVSGASLEDIFIRITEEANQRGRQQTPLPPQAQDEHLGGEHQ